VNLAELLSVAGLSVIQPDEREALYQQEGLPSAAILTRATMIKIAERSASDFMVIGSYRISGQGREGRIAAWARIIDVRRASALQREINLGEKIINLERLQAELAYEILRQLKGDSNLPSRDQLIGQATRFPIGAFENYIKGRMTADRDARIRFFERAIKEAEKAGQEYSDAIFELGRACYELGQYQCAIERLEKIRYGERLEEALFYLGASEKAAGNVDAALDALLKLASMLPLHEVYNNIGALLITKKLYKDAMSYLDLALQAAPRDPDVLFNLGYAHFLAGDYQKATAFLKKELERRPSDGEALYVMSKALAAMGDHARATEASDRAKRLLPEFARWEAAGLPELARMKADLNRASYYSQKHRRKMGLDQFQAQSSGSDQLIEAARAAFLAGRDAEALELLEQLLEIAPQMAEAHLLIGQIHERRGDMARAEQSLRAALFWNPKLIPAHLLLGRIAILKGDCSAARTWLNKAEQIDAGGEDVRALGRLLEQSCKPQ
jgi:tetratricopeptide (TPR) repeat protein